MTRRENGIRYIGEPFVEVLVLISLGIDGQISASGSSLIESSESGSRPTHSGRCVGIGDSELSHSFTTRVYAPRASLFQVTSSESPTCLSIVEPKTNLATVSPSTPAVSVIGVSSVRTVSLIFESTTSAATQVEI